MTTSCGCEGEYRGPGYASPLDAFNSGTRETLLYVPCLPSKASGKPDYLATIDVDPQSNTYSKVIHRLKMPNVGDELHHTGWNSCSSCYGSSDKQRRFLILPALLSGRFYVVDTQSEKEPKLHKVIEADEVSAKTGLAYPHTVHCLANGELLASAMGKAKTGEAEGGFVVIDGKTFEVKGRWTQQVTKYGYDFWYQPRQNVMVSSEWSAPATFSKGFNPQDVAEGKYGNKLYFWDWKERKIIQEVELGPEGLIPLEVRFLHDPNQAQGFVAAALSSTIIRFHRDNQNKWQTHTIIKVEPKQVSGWLLPHMPGLITDFVISLDDKFLYLSNWLHGDVRQYDISVPTQPKLVGQVFVGGSLFGNKDVKILSEVESTQNAQIVTSIQGTAIQGGPQMIQLSLDGKRLYVTTSLFSVWDEQFYPQMVQKGSQLVQIDVDTNKGGLSVNSKFLIDFGNEPDGPALAHEVRYPGGDCTSDIWI